MLQNIFLAVTQCQRSRYDRSCIGATAHWVQPILGAAIHTNEYLSAMQRHSLISNFSYFLFWNIKPTMLSPSLTTYLVYLILGAAICTNEYLPAMQRHTPISNILSILNMEHLACNASSCPGYLV